MTEIAKQYPQLSTKFPLILKYREDILAMLEHHESTKYTREQIQEALDKLDTELAEMEAQFQTWADREAYCNEQAKAEPGIRPEVKEQVGKLLELLNQRNQHLYT